MRCLKQIQEHGFTLIEMMVALAVVSVGIAAAISLVSSMGLNALRLEEKVQSQWIMANSLVQIKLKQFDAFDNSPLADSAKVEMGGREWYVSSRNSQTPLKNATATTVTVCLDLQKTDCVFEQVIFSSKKKVPLKGNVNGG